jgi:hypothetical protein
MMAFADWEIGTRSFRQSIQQNVYRKLGEWADNAIKNI